MKEKCMECNVSLRQSTSVFKGINLRCLQCPKCKEKIFTEALLDETIDRINAAHLEVAYKRKVIQVGSSLALTFPKVLAKAFELDGKTILLRPNLPKKKIELLVA